MKKNRLALCTPKQFSPDFYKQSGEVGGMNTEQEL